MSHIAIYFLLQLTPPKLSSFNTLPSTLDSGLSLFVRAAKVLLERTSSDNSTPKLQPPDLQNTASKMKPISIFPLLAIIISPALSQADAATDDNPSGVTIPKSSSDVIAFACLQSNILITDQLAEIKHLQSSNIEVTHDLAGYFYAVVRGRKRLGCPDLNPFTSHQGSTNTSSAQTLSKRSSEEEALVVE